MDDLLTAAFPTVAMQLLTAPQLLLPCIAISLQLLKRFLGHITDRLSPFA
jgi:hypothetical protein